MGQRALLLEAHHTTHIEGTQLTIAQAAEVWAGKIVQGTDADDVRELLNYRRAFDLVSEHLASGAPITEALVARSTGASSRACEAIARGQVSGALCRTTSPARRPARSSTRRRRPRRSRRSCASSSRGSARPRRPMPSSSPASRSSSSSTSSRSSTVEALGEQVIRADVVAARHSLNERQAGLVGAFIARRTLALADCEELAPGVARRTIQRDLKLLVERGLVAESG